MEFKVVAKYSDDSEKWLSPESNGNFLVTEALLGQELALAADKPNMTFDKAGTFTFTVKADLSTLTITGAFDEIELNTYTATFTTDYAWEEVYAYVWSGDGVNTVLGVWPGTKLNKNGETGLYDVVIEAETAPEYIIFSNGDGQQTDDLAFEDGKAYEYAAKGGDANLDGVVTTGDAVMAVSFALGTAEPTEIELKAADINENGVITVSDAVGIVNIALGVSEPEAAAKAYGYETNNFLTLNGQQVGLTNSIGFVAFQMDVTLAEGAAFNGVQLSQRANALQVVTNQVGENTWRIIAFSLGNAEITGSEGELLTINADGQLTISNIEFADANARAYVLGLDATTGIDGLTDGRMEGLKDAYNLAGQRVGSNYKGIVIQNGKKYIVK